VSRPLRRIQESEHTMNWTYLYTQLTADTGPVVWQEFEPGTERQISFEACISKWSRIVGRVVLKAKISRTDGGVGPSWLIGSRTFELREGKQGFEVAKWGALLNAVVLRKAIERGHDDEGI
jgi:hypothetical protein